jgi:hypothetical protein
LMELPNGMTMLVGLEWISGRLLGTWLIRLLREYKSED